MPIQDRLLQYMTDNLTRTGSSNPGVARALQGGAGNPAGAVPSPTFEFADQYAKQQMPPITPNYQAYQNPRDRYSDVVNAVRQHAMQLGGAGGNAGNRMGFVEGETGKNALRGLAAVGQTLAQAMMMKQMMDPGQQYYQPGSGRIISSNPNAMSPAEGMQMMMRERQLNYENDLAAMKTQSELMSKLAELEATGEQGYESNARGNAVVDGMMIDRAKLVPGLYKDITAGQQNESMAGYYNNKDAREEDMQPLEKAVKQSQEAQNLAGARSSNATASRTELGEQTDRAIAPFKVDSALYDSMVDEQEALNAPRKLAGDANKADAEGYMAQQEAKLPPSQRSRGYKPASETIKAEEGTNAVKTRAAALDAVLQYESILEGKEGAKDSEKITYPNSDGEEVTSTVGAIRKKIKLNRKRAAEAQARISGIGGGQDAPASEPQQTSQKIPQGASGRAMADGKQVGWIVNGRPIGFDGNPLPPRKK